MSDSLTDTSNANVIQTVNSELQNDGHLIFIVHGFSNNGQEEWVANLRRSIFDRYDNKTIIVGVVYWGWGMYHNAFEIQNLVFLEFYFQLQVFTLQQVSVKSLVIQPQQEDFLDRVLPVEFLFQVCLDLDLMNLTEDLHQIQ